MKIHPKRLIRFLIIGILLWTCKENVAQPKTELEKFKSECPKIGQGDFYWGKQCVKEKEFLTCVKLLNEIKNNGVGTFFWGRRWENSYKYEIDKKGIIKIKYYGPDGYIKVFKETGKIEKRDDLFFFMTPPDSDLNRPLMNFPIKRIDCELDNSNFERQGTFVMFTLSDGEKYQYGNSLKGHPLIGYKNSDNLFKPDVLPNPEVWHKVSLILAE
ncbi:hypothetical protein EHQ16_01045 [Leptospira kanakyensis]|uniref:Uncharacterized protein n=1 Tax=Leptospira kanakyensis TaxID=2484968 RepID=A0A6N4PTL0_9LEPT|nr:hypothetical protein [Leptospira kanakyensis]TGK47907.1 hypothetical protein EHQ11_18540 [Leptospira kanakyensis]TGK63085.1 hypothetical protein EHQ16_01045 [Leptospira kanakyensis]TGK66691.1 hypothetical protein EHQ18_16280 [Leptospira kanakyensis]